MGSRRRGVCLVLCVAVLVVCTATPASAGTAPGATDVILRGTGTAHGLGMAMDGVEGQARAGWAHDRILDLFYSGTTPGRAAGTIRVGLANEPVVTLSLPNGGVVSNAPRGGAAGAGFPRTIGSGARIVVRRTASGVAFELPSSKPDAEPANGIESRPTDAPGPIRRALGGAVPGLIPQTPPPIVEPTPTPSPKQPSASPGPAPATAPTPAAGALTRVYVWGTGDPALVSVAATGRRYRGSVEVVPHGGALNVVNHVDLETYVAGIAEEKGAGWPLEGLKVLAIAARSLGAATMSWYAKSHDNGYDICPTDQCQVYLGYDGEEPMMRRATSETAGVIRTYNGRPILAMYHGNGGGQTETYKRLIDYGGDPHPYLRSVTYPYADPYHWTRRETWASIEGSVRAAGIAVPGRLQGIDVLERGESPRIVKLRLRGSDGDVTITGQRFMDALDLWSTWFEIETEGRAVSTVTIDPSVGFPVASAPVLSASEPDRTWLALVIGLLAFIALAWATNLVLRELPAPGWIGVRGALLYGSDAAG
jgi:SpoIID/LytB domain protein